MADILLSYRTQERATADALAGHLADSGFSVSLAPRQSGSKPNEAEIDTNANQIDDATCVVTLWSRASSKAPSVLLEAQRAASQRKLVVADLQNTALPATLAGQPLIDLSGWIVTRDAADLKPLEDAVQSVIETVRLAANAVQPDIYLAYARKDENDATAVFGALERAGYDVWWDRKIPTGTPWEREIERGFFRAKLILLLASRDGLHSAFMRHYIALALQRGAKLLIAELEHIPAHTYPLPLRIRLSLDLSAWRANRDARELVPLFRTIETAIGPPRKQRFQTGRSPAPKGQQGPRPGHDVFVSYKREDRPKVTPYVDRFIGSGLQVWWDALIKPGSNWGLAVERALKESRSVAVFWTSLSVQSDEVYTEADHGMSIDALFPVLLETCDVPLRMRRIQYLDLTRSNSDHGFDDMISQIIIRVGA
jgi:hypothetical protein